MRRILVASHHRFAEGLCDTLRFVTGGAIDAIALNAYLDEVPLELQVNEIFDQFEPDDEVLVLTDMMQGSVNQELLRKMGQKVFVVTGINVPAALELGVAPSPLTVDVVEQIVSRAREQLVLMNTIQIETTDGDE